MSTDRARFALLGLVATVAACGLLAAPAAAAVPVDHLTPPLAGLFDFLSPIKNIAELITKVVAKLFGALAKALMPDFLKEAGVDTLKGLVAVPNLGNSRQWHNVGQLRSGTNAIAWALLPLPFTIATIRYLIGTFTDGPHPITAVTRLVGAGFGLALYPWAAGQAFALINVTTNALLSLPAVGNGLQRAVSVLFGAAIIAGIASPFIACLALAAIVMGTLLFGLKIAILMIAALLYVAGPLVIALYPLQETSHLYRAWLFAFIALAFIPIGWCLIFAVAGALTLDATSGGISAGLIAKDTTAALAALLAFGLAVLWPKVLIGHALQVAGGMGITLRGTTHGALPAPASPARAQAAVRGLRDGALNAGRGVGRAMGQLGAPAGGAAGWAGRLMARTPPGAAVAGMAGATTAAVGGSVARIRARAASGEGGRVTRAASELADIPGRRRTPPTDADPESRPSDTSPASPPTSPPSRSGPAPDAEVAADDRRRPGRNRRITPEQRAVLNRLPREVSPRVRQAVLQARPGHVAQAATRAAQRAEAPLSPQTRRAVFAAAAAHAPSDRPSVDQGQAGAPPASTRRQAGGVSATAPVPAPPGPTQPPTTPTRPAPASPRPPAARPTSTAPSRRPETSPERPPVKRSDRGGPSR